MLSFIQSLKSIETVSARVLNILPMIGSSSTSISSTSKLTTGKQHTIGSSVSSVPPVGVGKNSANRAFGQSVSSVALVSNRASSGVVKLMESACTRLRDAGESNVRAK